MFTRIQSLFNQVRQRWELERSGLTSAQIERYEDLQREIMVCLDKEARVSKGVLLANQLLEGPCSSQERQMAVASLLFLPLVLSLHQQKRRALEQEREALLSPPSQEDLVPFQGEGHTLATFKS